MVTAESGAEDLKQIAALTSLNHMMAGGYVSICTIRTIGTMLGVTPAGEAYQILDSLHCVKFSEMPPELRDRIPDLIREALNQAPTFVFESLRERRVTGEVIEIRPVRPPGDTRPSLLRRLLG